MGTIFFLGCAAATPASSNGHCAPTPVEAETFGKRATAFHGNPVNGVICTRDDHTFNVWRAFLKAHGTTYTSVHINDAPDVVGRGLEEAFDRTNKTGEDDPILQRTVHIRQEIVRLIDFAAGSTAYAVLIVAPADLLQPILYRLHHRWHGDNATPPPISPYGLIVVNVDAVKPTEGHKKFGDYVVANYKVVSSGGASTDHTPAENTVATAAVPAV